MENAMCREPVGGVAKPTFLGPLLPSTVGVIIWVTIVATEGSTVGLKYSWLLLLAVSLGLWTVLPRLHYWSTRLELTIGPWRRTVDLAQLQHIKWEAVRGAGNRGRIVVSDNAGGRVGIYVGRFTEADKWGPLLLESAARCGAKVDRHSRAILEHRQSG
jgi:hypothetical protein